MKSGPPRLVFERALVALTIGVCGVLAGCRPTAGAGGDDEGTTGPAGDDGGSGGDGTIAEDGTSRTGDGPDNAVGFVGPNLNPDDDGSGTPSDGNTGQLTI